MDKSISLDSRTPVDWTIDGVEGGYMDLVSTEYAWPLLEGLKRGQSDWSAITLDQIDLTPLAILAFDASRQATDGRIPGRMTTVQYSSTPDSLASGTELAVRVCDYCTLRVIGHGIANVCLRRSRLRHDPHKELSMLTSNGASSAQDHAASHGASGLRSTVLDRVSSEEARERGMRCRHRRHVPPPSHRIGTKWYNTTALYGAGGEAGPAADSGQ
nr:hypothetical protein CFP56_11689 [Quercus suber]